MVGWIYILGCPIYYDGHRRTLVWNPALDEDQRLLLVFFSYNTLKVTLSTQSFNISQGMVGVNFGEGTPDRTRPIHRGLKRPKPEDS